MNSSNVKVTVPHELPLPSSSKGSITFQYRTVIWGPCIQKYEPIGGGKHFIFKPPQISERIIPSFSVLWL